MFGHKCFLRIGQLNDSSISGLYKDSYELLGCNYSFSQGVDFNGKAQTEVKGGAIFITYPNVPPNDIIRWMLDSRKLENGAIVICDANDMPLEKVLFESAACTGMEISYMQKGSGFTATKITLQAKKIQVGSTTLENNWVHL
ncbi:MAG: type VI secretion system needle protein Hcp [Marinilabiliaceae bacterium]|nr:type VI secretion system needle protein Hcp [Marinilabiliaceae bacterium]